MDQPTRASADKYGSDRNGLVWGYAFRDGHSPAAIDSDQAAIEFACPPSEPTFYWLHFSLATPATERWLRHVECGLPKAFYEGLRAPSSATRVEQDGEGLVAVINDVMFDFDHERSDISTATLAVLPNALISTRLRPLRSMDRLRESIKSGTTCRSSVELLSRLLQNQADVLIDIVRRSGDQVDRIEDHVLVNRVGRHRVELSSLRRLLVRLERLMAPEPAALFRLLSRPPAWFDDEDLESLRRSAEEFSAVIADCTSLVERAKLIQEELAAMVTEQTNRSVFVLTFVTVLLLPFNVVGGLFGMNVGGIPYANNSYGFWVIIVFVSILTAAVGYFLLRRFRN